MKSYPCVGVLFCMVHPQLPAQRVRWPVAHLVLATCSCRKSHAFQPDPFVQDFLKAPPTLENRIQATKLLASARSFPRMRSLLWAASSSRTLIRRVRAAGVSWPQVRSSSAPTGSGSQELEKSFLCILFTIMQIVCMYA